MSKIKIFSLGGLNEIGKNMYVVEVNKDIFVFDAGLKYADDKMLGVDYIIPKYDYLKNNQDRIKGIFITHGHNEQMGALTDILPDLNKVKVYGTQFTIDILKRDLEEEKIKTDNLVVIKPHRNINFKENSIFPVSLSHSVPDTVGYVLNTQDGAIFYTGNFVFDPTMNYPFKTDIGKLAYIGKQGVLCLMAESRYASKIGYTSPQHRINKVISEVLYKYEKRILFNVFDGQIYRIQEIFNEIMHTDRKVIIMGKRLESIINDAIDKNYIHFDKTRFSNIHNAKDENVIILISDEREKPFSNLDRIIKRYDKFISKEEMVQAERERIENKSVPLTDTLQKIMEDCGTTPLERGCKMIELLKRPQITYKALTPVDDDRPDLPRAVFEQVEIAVKYEGYIKRQEQQIKEMRRIECKKIPADIDYTKLKGLRLEAVEKLSKIKPENLGQASRISGVTPADIAALNIILETL